jgi:NADH:ubiquinone oxidoreductase subunit 6 (subunit J)
MIMELIAIGLVVSAFLAIHFDEAVYSIASLTCTFIFMAIIFALNDVIFAAIFQIAIASGTLSVLFLSGEMLSEKPVQKKKARNIILATAFSFLLSLPMILISIPIIPATSSPGIPFPQTLYDLRAVDIILQGLIILTVALGIAIIIREKKGRAS